MDHARTRRRDGRVWPSRDESKLGQERDHAIFAKYLFAALSDHTDERPHRLIRNWRLENGVNAWRTLQLVYELVTNASRWKSLKREQLQTRAARR